MGPSSKTLVGLDIEPGYVAAVKAAPDGPAVEHAAYAPLAPGVVRDGEVVDVDTLAAVLRQLFAQNKLGKRVRLGVANQRIVMRTIDLPPLTDAKQIASAIRFQAQDHIPMPLDQAVLEHQLLGIVETPDGPRTRVVLVAARRDMIDRLLEATTRAGLRPQGIDLSAFAMIRALHRRDADGHDRLRERRRDHQPRDRSGHDLRLHARDPLRHRVDRRRARRASRAHARARTRLAQARRSGDAGRRGRGRQEIVLEARSVLTEGVRRIGDEVRNSLDFHAMQDGSTAVDRVVLTGPAVAIPGFADQIGQQIGLPIEVGLVAEGKPGGFSGIDAGRLAVAAGLTIDEVPS